MSLLDDEIIRELNETDNEFKQLFDQHQDYEKKLKGLKKRKYLSADESLEMNRLKKLKLQGKDRMNRRIQLFRASV